MSRRLRSSSAVVFAMMLVGAAYAEHEADHRYTVRGFVLDDRHQPIAGQRVTIDDLRSAITDSNGEYRIVLHLHNADLGKMLRISSGGVESTIRVNFDPGDTHSARVHHANFIAGQLVAGELEGKGFPVWGYVGVAAVLISGGLLFGLRGRRTRSRAAVVPHPTKRRKSRRSGKKRKRS